MSYTGIRIEDRILMFKYVKWLLYKYYTISIKQDIQYDERAEKGS